MFPLSLCGFSLGTPAFTHIPASEVNLFGHSKLPIGVNVCWSLYVSLVKWRVVQGLPHHLPCCRSCIKKRRKKSRQMLLFGSTLCDQDLCEPSLLPKM